MALMPILHHPDPRLRIKARPVVDFGPSLQKLVDDMFETMYDAPGVGLAATQVGVDLRLAVMDAGEETREPVVMINPEILGYSEETVTTEEGCLSIPELYYEVARPAEVTVRYTDLDGKEVERHASDRLAICIQHELDHLDGVLYIDYLSRLKRDRVLKKFQKAARRTG